MTGCLTATIGLGTLAVTGGAFAMLPAEAALHAEAQQQVDVSIGHEGHVNIAGTGLVPVVIHGGDGIDATAVDPSSITVDGGVEPVRTSTGAVIANIVDMDSDGSDDLVVHVDQADLRRTGDLTTDVTAVQVSADSADGATIEVSRAYGPRPSSRSSSPRHCRSAAPARTSEASRAAASRGRRTCWRATTPSG